MRRSAWPNRKKNYYPPIAEKVCGHCEQLKPADQFSPNPEARSGLHAYCKACNCTLTKESAAKRDPELRKTTSRKFHLKKKYGLSLEEYQQMWEEQGGVCKVCGRPEGRVTNPEGKVSSLSVDHNHETGEVRGLLCHACNTALGQLNEDPAIIQNLLGYLAYYAERH